MDNVMLCIKALVASIRHSSQYQAYADIKKKLEEEPELKKRIDEFRKKNFLLQNSEEEIDLYEEITRLQEENEEFRKNPLVNEYLKAELGVCRMMQRIVQEVVGAIDMDIDGIAEEINL